MLTEWYLDSTFGAVFRIQSQPSRVTLVDHQLTYTSCTGEMEPWRLVPTAKYLSTCLSTESMEDKLTLVPYQAKESAFPMLSNELSSGDILALLYANIKGIQTVFVDDSHEIDTHGWNRFIGSPFSTIITLKDDQCICTHITSYQQRFPEITGWN